MTALACAWPYSGHAQARPPPPPLELRRQDLQRQELRQQLETQPWSPAPSLARTPEHQRLPQEQPCSIIEHIDLQGPLASPRLQAALSGVRADDPPQGRCLGAQGITLLVQRVQQALVEQGHVTSHVHVPEQDLRSGTLRLRIDEGRVGRIRPADTEGLLPRLAWAMRPGDILSLRDVEQSSDNLLRLPRLDPQLQIEPGETPGTSDVVVSLQTSRPLRLGLTLDDSGQRSTGQIQGSLSLAWDNPLDLSDLAYITWGRDAGGRDDGPRGSAHQILHYSLPWGYWLLSATWSRNRYHQTVHGPWQSYLYHGTSTDHELTLQRVLQRDGRSKTTATLKGFQRRSNQYIDDLEVQVQRQRSTGWEAGAQHLHHTPAGTLTAQLAHRQGTDRTKATTGALHWAMPLGHTGHPWHYSTQLQWQWGRTRSSAQDQFCIGGRTTVRGFDGSQVLCGDHGQLWRQELSAPWPGQPSAHTYLALDMGRTRTPGQGRAQRLGGIAVGLRGQFPVPALTHSPIGFDLFMGWPLACPKGFETPRRTAGFHLRAEF